MIEVDASSTKGIALIALLIILLLNVFGVKKVEKTQLVIVSISVVSLIAIIFLGANSFDSKLLDLFFQTEVLVLLRVWLFYIFLMLVLQR